MAQKHSLLRRRKRDCVVRNHYFVDGASRFGIVSKCLAGVRWQSRGNVNRNHKFPAFTPVHLLNHFAEQAFHRTADAGSKQCVHDEIRGVDSWLRSLPVGCSVCQANFTARFLPTLTIYGSVAAHFIFTGEENHDGDRARIR